MNRTPDEWSKVDADAVVAGSLAQARNVLRMALQDIAALAAEPVAASVEPERRYTEKEVSEAVEKVIREMLERGEIVATRSAPRSSAGNATDLAKRLHHAAVTMQNDDLSEPQTEKRRRHVERYEALIDAVEYLSSTVSQESAGNGDDPSPLAMKWAAEVETQMSRDLGTRGLACLLEEVAATLNEPQGVSETYRETVKKVAAAREKAYAAARANLQEAWAAMALILETVETLGPIGAVAAAEHLEGPTFMHEAEAIVQGIQALALAR